MYIYQQCLSSKPEELKLQQQLWQPQPSQDTVHLLYNTVLCCISRLKFCFCCRLYLGSEASVQPSAGILVHRWPTVLLWRSRKYQLTCEDDSVYGVPSLVKLWTCAFSICRHSSVGKAPAKTVKKIGVKYFIYSKYILYVLTALIN